MDHAVLTVPRGDLRPARRRAPRHARAELDGHLADCPDCAGLGRRRGRRHPPGPAGRRARRCPTSPPPCSAALPRGAARGRPPPPGRGWSATALRLALLAVGVAQAGLAWPALASGPAAMSAPVHMAHETGAWNLARRRRVPRRRGRAAAGRRRAALPRHLRRAPGAGHPRRPGGRPRARPTAPPCHLLLLAGAGAGGVGRLARAAGAGARAVARPAGAGVRRARLPARPARAAGCSPASSPPARRRRTPRWSPPTRGRAPGSTRVAVRGHAAVQRGRLARRRVRAGARRPAASGSTPGRPSVDGDVLTIPLRSGLPDDGYLVTYRVISADSHPIAGAYSFVVGNGDLVPAGAAADGDRTDPVVGAALPLMPVDRVRRPRPRRRRAGARAALLARRLGLAPGCAGWRRWGAVAVAVGAAGSFLLQGPYAAAQRSRLAVRPLAAARATARLRGRPGAAGPRSCWRSAWPRAAAGLAPRRGRRRPAGSSRPASLAAGARGQHRRDRAPRRRAVAGARGRRHGRARRGDGGLAGRPGRPARRRCCGRDVPADDVAAVVPRYSRLAFAVGGRAGRQRHRAGRARGRVADGAVRHDLRLGARGQARAWSPSCWPRPGSPGSGCSSGSACAGPGPADGAASPRTRSPRRGRRRRRCEAAAEARGHAQSESAAEHAAGAAPLGAGRGRASPPSSWRCRRSWSGCPPARAAVAQPVDATAAAAGQPRARRAACRCRSTPPGPGANTLHLYLFDDDGRLTQPAGITVSLTEASQQIGPLDVKLQPAGPGPLRRRRHGHPRRRHLDPHRHRPARRVHRHHRQHRLPGALTPPMNRSSVSLPRPSPASPWSSLAALTACSASAGLASAHVAVSSPDAARRRLRQGDLPGAERERHGQHGQDPDPDPDRRRRSPR